MIPVPDLLTFDSTFHADQSQLEELLGLAFTGRGEPVAFDTALAGENRPRQSDFDPEHFSADLFLPDLVERTLTATVDGTVFATNQAFLLRVLESPPPELDVVRRRQAILRELATDAEIYRSVEALYVRLWNLVQMFRVPGRMARLDIDLFRIELMRLFKESVDAMVVDFEGARSDLRTLSRVALEIQTTEEYRTLDALLDWEGHRGTVRVDLRMGAGGRVADLRVREIAPNQDNRFFDKPVSRWLQKVKAILWWGFRLTDEGIVARLTQSVYDQMSWSILSIVQLLGHLEIYLAMHQWRERSEAEGLALSLAELSEDGALRLKDLFNPLLQSSESADPVVPCTIGEENARSVTLLTGPNSGGKTRLLQSIGLAQILGQGGFYVPARSARLVQVRGLYVSLIENEAIDHAEGRLGRELERIRSMFDAMRVPSMVILDELCSGTNPSEGAEVFSLVLRLLERVRPTAYITTHFLDYARRLADRPPIHHLHFLQVEIDRHQRSTYQFLPGVADTSLAAVMAERMGVTFDRIADALDRHPDATSRPRPLAEAG
ncbi:MAG: DNA mismatch repair protein [Thermoanaerobaculia bacterium]|nr:DNA mismatch repair protein [Thermoanaerobaculia bacterium]